MRDCPSEGLLNIPSPELRYCPESRKAREKTYEGWTCYARANEPCQCPTSSQLRPPQPMEKPDQEQDPR